MANAMIDTLRNVIRTSYLSFGYAMAIRTVRMKVIERAGV
jgi:hypothetical protein